MKHVVVAISIILLMTAAIYSQSDKADRIKEIREHYESVKSEIAKIERSEEAALQSELAVNELVVNKLNKSWPAVGNYSVVYRFYYKQTGEQNYPETLVLVTKKTVSAARTYSQEYLFEESGKLMFYFEASGSESEYRIYFKNGKMLEFKGTGDKAVAVAAAAAGDAGAKAVREIFRQSIE
ncbi:MAG: hypothetical protein OEQ28_10105 [Acidobacteriota bacterium]|nr:hypothetical protein [Acidobacteriota bacterium]